MFSFHFQDIVGKRGILALLCCILTVPVFGLLGFSNVHPLVSTTWLGVTYSFAAVIIPTDLLCDFGHNLQNFAPLFYTLWASIAFITR